MPPYECIQYPNVKRNAYYQASQSSEQGNYFHLFNSQFKHELGSHSFSHPSFNHQTPRKYFSPQTPRRSLVGKVPRGFSKPAWYAKTSTYRKFPPVCFPERLQQLELQITSPTIVAANLFCFVNQVAVRSLLSLLLSALQQQLLVGERPTERIQASRDIAAEQLECELLYLDYHLLPDGARKLDLENLRRNT